MAVPIYIPTNSVGGFPSWRLFQDHLTSKRWGRDLNPGTFWLLVQRGNKHDLEGKRSRKCPQKCFLQLIVVTMRNWIKVAKVNQGARYCESCFFFFFFFKFSCFYCLIIDIYFLATLCSLWDRCFPTRDKPGPCQWKHQVLTTGPQGNSLLHLKWILEKIYLSCFGYPSIVLSPGENGTWANHRIDTQIPQHRCSINILLKLTIKGY